jgi:hypothetical protein
MALVVKDRVQETTTTTGTGTITLAGAVAGFQSFSVIGNSNTTYYCVTSGSSWEVGIGTYTLSGTTLARTTILASSAGGSAITLAGTSNVFCVYPASKSVYADSSNNVSGYAISGGTIDNTPIGGTTATTGKFTTLNSGPAVSGYTFSVDSESSLNTAWFTSSDAGATGLNISFKKDSASPAANDILAQLRFYGNDSVGGLREYVRISGEADNVTSGATAGTFHVYTISAAGTVTERLRWSDTDGLYNISGNFRSPTTYGNTTATAANMVMANSTGILQRSTSSIRYKNSVEDASYGLNEVMQLRPVTYKGNNDGDKIFGGFIAEEIHDLGLTHFVQYDEQNRPDALAYGNMVSLLTKAIQEQQVVIEDLKTRLGNMVLLVTKAIQEQQVVTEDLK